MNGGITRERLDRVVTNHEWSQFSDVIGVDVLPRNCSDHNPLLVFFSKHHVMAWRKQR